MENPDCEVCQALFPERDQEVVLENLMWRVALSNDQIYLGRAYVTLKRHAGSLPEVTVHEWLNLQAVMRRYEAAVRQAFGARVFNWACLMNNAFKLPNPAPHIHWHVRPRYDQPVNLGDKVYEDPNFGHHFQRHTAWNVSPEDLKLIAAAIQEAMPV